MTLVHARGCECCDVARKRITEVSCRVDREIAQFISFRDRTKADYDEARERTKHLVADWAAEPWRSQADSFFGMTSINVRNALAQLCHDLKDAQDEIVRLRAQH